MAATNAGLFRKRLSLGSGGKAPPSGLRAAAPTEACTLLDITAATSNSLAGAAAAPSGAVACQQRAVGQRAAAAAAEPSAGSSDGWDDDDDAAPSWDLLGDLGCAHALHAAHQAPVDERQDSGHARPPLQLPAASPGAGLQKPEDWASPAAAARQPAAAGGAGPPSGRPSAAWRSAGGSTARRRRRMRSVFAGEDEEAGGGDHAALAGAAGDCGSDDGDEDLYAARSGQRPAAGSRLSLQRSSPAGAPDSGRQDAAGAAARAGVDALPAAAARPQGNPFARAGAGAEGSRITLASSVGTAARGATVTAAAAAAEGAAALLDSLPANAAADAPPARPWAQRRAFKPPRADPRQRQQQQAERTARAAAALGSSSSDADFEEAVPAERAGRRRSAGGQLPANCRSSQAPLEARPIEAGAQQQQVKREQEVVSLLSGGDGVVAGQGGGTCAAAQPAATEPWRQQQQDMLGGWRDGAPPGPQPDLHRTEAAWQQRQQWPAPDVAPSSGGGQLFWQASEDDDGWEGDGDWGWQQQQQRGWQAPDGLASHAAQPYHRPTQPLPGTAGGRQPGWQAAGGGGGPWWARFPDFVPVAALLGGRDPRDGCQVFIGYQQQFSGSSGGGATAASKRAAASSPFVPAGVGGRSRKRGEKRAGKDDGGGTRSCWVNEGGKNVYYDARGRKLWGQRGYLAAKREKGEPGGAGGGSGSGGRMRSGGGGRKRSGGSRKRIKR